MLSRLTSNVTRNAAIVNHTVVWATLQRAAITGTCSSLAGSNSAALSFHSLHSHSRYSTASTASVSSFSSHHRGFSIFLVFGCAAIGLAYVISPVSSASAAAATPLSEAGKIAASEGVAKPPKGGWPVYSVDEIAQHSDAASRIWVSYHDGVYDITDFISQHPGGASKIMLGAGGAIDPFWMLYRQHNHESVRMLLAKYRIGTLAGFNDAKNAASFSDPYAEDPKRHRALRVRSPKPFNAEPPLDVLGESYITPNELFYVRNHLPVPHIDKNEFRLTVGGEGLVERVYTLDQLRESFPRHSIIATLQCAGNRRSEMNAVKAVKGLGFGQAAISNAEWTGVRLQDVLKAQGLRTDQPHAQNIKHVHFEGLDADVTGTAYAASIPIDKVVDGSSDVLLAWEMNGVPLPLDHGYPLRAVVPGVVAARHVKWLGSVMTSPEESPGHWQQNDYKAFSPNIDWSNVDFSTAPAIQEMPVTSAITEPSAGSRIHPGRAIKVKGYAWSGGGRGIVRVDVSADGINWQTAKLHPQPASETQSLNRAWAWTPWSIELTLPADAPTKDGTATLMCKAIDSSYNNQPESYAPIWNLRGCVSNAWHKVPIQIEGEKKSEQRKQ